MIKFGSFNRTIIEHLVSLLTQSLLINTTSTAASTLTAVHVRAISGLQIMVGWHRGKGQYHIKYPSSKTAKSACHFSNGIKTNPAAICLLQYMLNANQYGSETTEI